VSIADLAVSPGPEPEAQFQSEFKNDLLGEVVVLRHTGVAHDRDSIAQCSVLPIQQPSGAEPTGAADVYSLLCTVQPAADGDAGLDSTVKSLMCVPDNSSAVEHLR
jgi:hypothetical protein